VQLGAVELILEQMIGIVEDAALVTPFRQQAPLGGDGQQAQMRNSAIRGRIVNPCTMSVPSTTVKALSTITLRPGNCGGSAKAVASVTRPRIPHHDTNRPMRAGGSGGRNIRCSKKVRKERSTQPYAITQRKRTPITTASTMAAKTSACLSASAGS
jgi:hypothetical protein